MAKKKKPENQQPDDVKIEPFRQNLPVILKREEVEQRAQRAAHLVADHDVKAAQFKDQAAENKRALAALETQIRELSGEVRSGKTYLDVQCERVFNWTKGTVTDIRKDTGEALSERAMTEAEKQKALPFDKPGDVDDEFGGGEGTDSDSETDPEGEAAE
jgi:hypothetical protein